MAQSNSVVAPDEALAALGTTQQNAGRYADGKDREYNTELELGEAGSVWRTGQALYVGCFFWQLPRRWGRCRRSDARRSRRDGRSLRRKADGKRDAHDEPSRISATQERRGRD